MNITIAIFSKPIDLSAIQLHDTAHRLVTGLAGIHEDFRSWWANPASPKDGFVPLAAQDAIVERITSTDDGGGPTSDPPPHSRHLILTNAGSERDWARRGRISLTLRPGAGQIRLSAYEIEKVFRDPHEVCWSLLSALVRGRDVDFAHVNVTQRVGSERLIYSMNRAPFQHRQFLGWMGYVPAALTAEQVPEAERLVRCGPGTLVLATKLLDLGNPAAIKQANQVEMRLADLDMLPVLDDALR